MLRTTKLMKDKYEKIQRYLFSMIPEKWDEIYLYASVSQSQKGRKTGELYFYYLPRGILKKKPVNVYEVPHRFNINEQEYLSVVQNLYACIKELYQDFIETEQELWNSLTISIANFKFKVEYNYDPLPRTEKDIEAKRIIWRYKYLEIGGDKKEEKKVLDDYFENKNRYRTKKEVYETGLYLKTGNNEISFDKEEIRRIPKFEREDKPKVIINEEFEKVKQKNKNFGKQIPNQNDDNNKKGKNQILNM